ncbi:MAG: DUF2384 domain-containing protein [Gammaproteobacteria bacterium]|nr:DUF2384 domain-containing protein [Gammaproteobacteria bacterium]
MPTFQQSRITERSGQVALFAFFRIMKAWHIKTDEQRTILGNPSESIFYNLKNGEASVLSNDILERISSVLGIYKALITLFPTREQANAWLLKPNVAFQHKSALEVMLKGRRTHLREVRRYLDAQHFE